QGFGSNPSVFMANAAGGEDQLTIISADDGMIEAELATTSPGTYTVWVVSEKPGNAPGRSDDVDVGIEVQVPVGAIMAWHKDLSSSVGLPGGWVECNGQVLDDTGSPYNGQIIPDLNGQALFLRGGTASGATEDDAVGSHDHDVNLTADAAGSHDHSAETSVAAGGGHGHNASTGIAAAGSHGHGANTSIGAAGAHGHSIKVAPPLPGGSGFLTGGPAGWSGSFIGSVGNHAHSASTSIDAGGNHAHSASTSITSAPNHDHDASTSIEANGDHSHTVSGKTAAEGEAETRPVNMSVVWIMRVK
ncbi:MAG: hypothetical protein D3918_16160, partial [Candidatus Electrothrix sp. AX2]|nr:hypothetical protein [Candidatus Electrothrix gigas]